MRTRHSPSQVVGKQEGSPRGHAPKVPQLLTLGSAKGFLLMAEAVLEQQSTQVAGVFLSLHTSSGLVLHLPNMHWG